MRWDGIGLDEESSKEEQHEGGSIGVGYFGSEQLVRHSPVRTPDLRKSPRNLLRDCRQIFPAVFFLQSRLFNAWPTLTRIPCAALWDVRDGADSVIRNAMVDIMSGHAADELLGTEALALVGTQRSAPGMQITEGGLNERDDEASLRRRTSKTARLSMFWSAVAIGGLSRGAPVESVGARAFDASLPRYPSAFASVSSRKFFSCRC